MMVRIVEFSPGAGVAPRVTAAIGRLLAGIDKIYVAGLDRVVLRSSLTLGKRELRRLRSLSRGSLRNGLPRGLYYKRTATSPAYIVIFFDLILGAWPRIVFYVPFFADAAFSKTLFHEIGHHVHRALHPEYRDSEAIANEWKTKLRRSYFRGRYWYLVPLFGVLRLASPFLRFLRRSSSKPTTPRRRTNATSAPED